jgi:hypothetical protein
MRNRPVVIFALSLLFVACSSLPKPTRPPASIIPPPPTLEPATNFVKGLSQVPTGQFLFVTLRNEDVCSSECNCPVVEPPRKQYGFSPSGELWLSPYDIRDPTSILTSTLVGLFGYGRWNERVYVIKALPYQTPPYGEATIYSVDAQGTIVVEVQAKTYFVRPGQAWTEGGDVKREPPPGCHITFTSQLSNHGLLLQAKIRIGDPYTYR